MYTQYPRVAHTLTQVRNHVNDTTLASRGEVEITLSRRWNFRKVDGNLGILGRIIKIFDPFFLRDTILSNIINRT